VSEEAEPRRGQHHALRPEHVRAVRLGHGANCSSIGSVVDALFASAVVGAAVFAAVVAAMKKEPVTVVGEPPPGAKGEAPKEEPGAPRP